MQVGIERACPNCPDGTWYIEGSYTPMERGDWDSPSEYAYVEDITTKASDECCGQMTFSLDWMEEELIEAAIDSHYQYESRKNESRKMNHKFFNESIYRFFEEKKRHDEGD